MTDRSTHTHKPATARKEPRHRPAHHAQRTKIGQREVVRYGIARAVLQDLFHYFMTVTWSQLFVTLAAFFLAFDLLFGWLFSLRPGCIANLNPPGFLGAFFFSVETLATVGYGDMHPQTLYGHVLAMIEMFIGLMMLALITGIMFARFSRPRARFLFANSAVVRPMDGRLTLMFRAANARQNVVQDASAQLRMLRDEVTREGYGIRRILDLALVRDQHPVFSLGWNIMHIIDESSPLYAETPESLRAANASFILSLTGTDETTGQVLMAREQYPSSAIRWNQSFKDIVKVDEHGTMHFDYGKFHEVEALDEGDSR